MQGRSPRFQRPGANAYDVETSHDEAVQTMPSEDGGNKLKTHLPKKSLATETGDFTYPIPAFDLLERHIDEPRELRVAVIGGGLAGITAGILLPAKVPRIKLTIFEKNRDLVSSFPYNDFKC